jgi:subtilisin family serine protease
MLGYLMKTMILRRTGRALSVLFLAAMVAGVALLTVPDRVEAQVSSRIKQSLQKRKARVSCRYDIIGPNETLIGVRLPPPWNTFVAKPSTLEFYQIHDKAWNLLLEALFPNGRPTRVRTKALLPATDSIETFASAPHIFRLHGLQPEAIPLLRKHPNILFVSTDPGVVNIEARAPTQNEVINPKQINLDNPGDVPFTDLSGNAQQSVKGMDIDGILPWRWSIGSTDVVVAIIDDTFDLSKPELKENLYTNTLEVPCNGIDDDRNGYVDDATGYDVTRKTGCIRPSSETSTHGTSMALTIAAPFRRPTEKSIVGIAPGVRFLPVHLNNNFKNINEAYTYIATMKKRGVPVRVINLSLGLPMTQNLPITQFECALVARTGRPTPLGELLASDVTIVAAAGNEGSNNDIQPVCPGNFASVHPHVVTVGAVDPAGKHPFFSNFGKISVTTSAPGSAVYTGYGYSTGTSVAAAHVSGIAALMYSIDSSLTAKELKEILIGATRYKELDLPTVSRGIVSANLAATAVAQRVRPTSLRKPPL